MVGKPYHKVREELPVYGVLYLLPAGISLKRAIMNHCLLCFSFFAGLLLPCDVSGDPSPVNILFVANQMDHSVLLVDPVSKQALAIARHSRNQNSR